MKSYVTRIAGETAGAVPTFEEAIRRTTRGLGGQLIETPNPLARALGEDLTTELELGRSGPMVSPDEVIATIADRTGIRPMFALELVQAILAELGERLGPVGRVELRRQVSPSWAVFIEEPKHRLESPYGSAPPRRASGGRTLATAQPSENTLARGKPGSKHSLVDAD